MKLGRKRKLVTARGQYWGEEQDNAIRAFKNESDHIKRSIIFGRYIYPQLHAMADAILKRYFGKYYNTDLVLDVITHVCERGMVKYNPDEGKSYSYFQACIKYYYLDKLSLSRQEKKKKERYVFESIDEYSVNDEGVIVPKAVIVSDENDEFDEERYNEALAQLLKKRREFAYDKGCVSILSVLINLSEEK